MGNEEIQEVKVPPTKSKILAGEDCLPRARAFCPVADTGSSTCKKAGRKELYELRGSCTVLGEPGG